MSTKLEIEVYQEQGNERLIEFTESISDKEINQEKIDKNLYSELINNKDVISKCVASIKKHDNDQLLIIPNAAYNFIRITKINDTEISSFVKTVTEDNFTTLDLEGFNNFHNTDIRDYEAYSECIDTFCQDTITSVEYLLGS